MLERPGGRPARSLLPLLATGGLQQQTGAQLGTVSPRSGHPPPPPQRGLGTENSLSREFLVVWSLASLLLLARRFCREKSAFSCGVNRAALAAAASSPPGTLGRNLTLLSNLRVCLGHSGGAGPTAPLPLQGRPQGTRSALAETSDAEDLANPD